MSNVVGEATIILRTDGTAVGPSTKAAGKKAGSGFRSGFVSQMKGLLGAVGISAAAIGVTKLISGSIAEARAANKVAAVTKQHIKTTGAAAHVTAKYVGELANRQSLLTGVDDELVQTGENLLLTFKNVRNEVGQGNDIFTRATKAALDLAASGFGSVESGSKMLGKALNDPIKGLTALGRAGVTFSEKQKTNIKHLVETNHTLEAQKMIMKEVESQVGGTAAATATSGSKMRAAWGQTAEEIGQILLPALSAFNDFLRTKVIPAVDDFVQGFKDGTGPGGEFRDILGRIKDIAGELWPAVQLVWQWVSNLFNFISTNLWVMDLLVGAWIAFKTALLIHDIIAGVVGLLGILTAALGAETAGAAAAATATGTLDATLAALVWPITLAVLAIAALAVGFIYAYKHSETFRKFIDQAMFGAKTSVQTFVTVARTQLRIAGDAFHALGGIVTWLWRNAFLPSINGILTLLATFLDALGFVMDAASHLPFVGDKFKGIADKIHAAAAAVRGFRDDLNGVPRNIDINVNIFTHHIGRPGPANIDLPGGPGTQNRTQNQNDRVGGAGAGAARAARRTLDQIARDYIRTGQHIIDNLAKGMAKKHPALVKELRRNIAAVTKANEKLQSLIDQRKQMAQSVAESLRGGFDLSAGISEPNQFGFGGGTTTFQSVAANVAQFAAKAKRFTGILRRLLKAGIPRTLVQEVAGLGIIQGTAVGNALLTGSREEVRSLAADWSGISAATNAAGNVIAGAFFNVGIAAQEELLRGLFNRALLRRVEHLSDQMIAAANRHRRRRRHNNNDRVGSAGAGAAAETVVPLNGPGSQAEREQRRTVHLSDRDIERLADALARRHLDLTVEVGATGRTKARWYIDGKRAAEAMA